MVRAVVGADLGAGETQAGPGEDPVDPHPRTVPVRREGVAEAAADLGEGVVVTAEHLGEEAAATGEVGVAGDEEGQLGSPSGGGDRLELLAAKDGVLREPVAVALEDAAALELPAQPTADDVVEAVARRDGMDVEHGEL